MEYPYQSCPLEILTKYINNKFIESGLKCLESDPKNIPGHTVKYRELINNNKLPTDWYNKLPESIEIQIWNIVHIH